jgi:predicted TPR repeat methyltransferase
MYSFEDHYKKILSTHYSRIFGGKNLNYEKTIKLFADFNIKPRINSIAFDLGAGCGFYSIPMARMGYKVKAIDLSNELLEEIRKEKNKNIEVINDDILVFDKYVNDDVDLVVCTTDVISHLNSYDEIKILIKKIPVIIGKRGKFLLSFRDYTKTRNEEDRFIPFYSDEKLIVTTFVEQENIKMKVTDIFYRRENDKWSFTISSYIKLRLYNKKVKAIIKGSGLTIEKEKMESGIIYILCKVL